MPVAASVRRGEREEGGIYLPQLGPDFTDLPFGLLGEFKKQRHDLQADGLGPLANAEDVVEGRLGRDLQIHLNVGIEAGTSRVEKANLCIDLQGLCLPATASAGDDAVPTLRDFHPGLDGDGPEWLNRPVLVACVDARKQREGMAGTDGRAVVVRLVPTHLCKVCSPDPLNSARSWWIGK